MPRSLSGALLVGARYACAFQCGLVVGERDQLPGEESAFVPVQVERAALDCFDSDRVGVEEIEELLEFERAPVEPV